MTSTLLIAGAVVLLLIAIFFLIVILKEHAKSRAIQKDLLSGTKPPIPSRKPAPAEKKKKEETPPKKRTASTEPALRKPPTPQPESISKEEIGPKEPPTEKTIEPSIPSERSAKDLYGVFDTSRLVEEMGLAPSEVDEFIVELIHQLEIALPEIKTCAERGDYQQMERITHGLKGAATNVGVGGIADLLVAFNSHLKTGGEKQTVEKYLKDYITLLADLKSDHAQKSAQ